MLSIKDLRSIINQELANRGWNVTRLAAESGVPQPTLHRFLSGTHGEPRSATIKKIAAGFGLTEMQLRAGHIDKTDTTSAVYREIPVFISVDEYQALPVKTRAFIEDFIRKCKVGALTEEHVKLLHNVLDVLNNKGDKKSPVMIDSARS